VQRKKRVGTEIVGCLDKMTVGNQSKGREKGARILGTIEGDTKVVVK